MAGPGLGYEILGAVKVKDGLFIGDELAAQDLEFVVSNKVTRVINCCGRQVQNHWEAIGVVYLTYYWVDADNQVILDQRDVVANEVFRFVEEALTGAESVLIHSVRGQSRSCCVLSAYMMRKHSWGLRKTMEFLSFRRPDMNLKPAFLQQLSGYERRLMSQGDGKPFSLDWNDADFSRLESEELLLRNTYINSQMGPLAEFNANDINGPGKPRRLFWTDADKEDKAKLEKPPGADKVQVIQGPDGQLKAARGVLKKSMGGGQGHPAAHAHPGAASAPSQPLFGYGQGGQGGQPTSHGHPVAAVAGPPPGQGQPPARAGGQGHPAAHAHPVAAAVAAAVAPGPPGHGQGSWEYCNPEVQYPPALGGAPAPQQPQGYGPPPGGCVPSAYVPVYGAPGQQLGSTAELQQPQQPPQLPPQQQPAFHRGPATNMRDSLQVQRRESPEPSRAQYGSGSRPPSRDPSPKAGPGRRTESPSTKGKPPPRYVSPAGSRRSSSQPTGSGAYPPTGGGRPPVAATSSAGGYPSYPGLSLSGVRAGSAPAPGPGAATPPPGGGPPRGGMTAFRNGPVRAKADVIGADGAGARRSRPNSAPSGAGRSSSRPSSPLGAAQRSGSQSRPPSPGTSRSSASPGPGPAPRSAPPTGGGSASYPHAQTQRSFSGHMRRAPSPTPAFNRNPSPSKPRWRG